MVTESSHPTSSTHPRSEVHQRQRQVVVWGCAEHQTPPGEECQGCAAQGELFSRADVADLARKTPYRRRRTR
jgi:hypothetical protein